MSWHQTAFATGLASGRYDQAEPPHKGALYSVERR
jgi:hypothetical protein